MAEAPKPPARRRRSRQQSAVEQIRSIDFPVAMRGYDRGTVDKYVADVAQLVAELEATQTREGVVQRALDEVGEQTSGILQHAHDTAEEIAARSRAQADERLQRAEQEAAQARQGADAYSQQTRDEADRYSEQVVEDTRRLWDERQQLIEDMRQLADEVLGVADDALDRVEPPSTGFVGADAEVAGEGVVAEDPPALDVEQTAVWELPDDQVEDPPAEDPTLDDPADETTVDESGAADPTVDESATSEFEAPAAPERGDQAAS
jgi:DivIVA domain-containing protein